MTTKKKPHPNDNPEQSKVKPDEWLYRGFRTADRECCVMHRDGHAINWRLDLESHSPTGLEWGYSGSGPAQCSLALLADYLEDDIRARKLHHAFKWKVISNLPRDGEWFIVGQQMHDWIKEIER